MATSPWQQRESCQPSAVSFQPVIPERLPAPCGKLAAVSPPDRQAGSLSHGGTTEPEPDPLVLVRWLTAATRGLEPLGPGPQSERRRGLGG